MELNKISKGKICWLNQKQSDGIIISTRIRLARNLEKYLFSQRSSIREKEEIFQKVKEIVSHNSFKVPPPSFFIHRLWLGGLEPSVVVKVKLAGLYHM